jgi:hypothetical protein
MLVFVEGLVLPLMLTRRNFWHEIRFDKFRILGVGNCVLRFVFSDLSSNELEEKKSHNCRIRKRSRQAVSDGREMLIKYDCVQVANRGRLICIFHFPCAEVS